MKDYPSKIRASILPAADSPEKLRPCDVQRVYESAADLGVVAEVLDVLKKRNPPAYRAMIEYVCA